MSRTAVLREKYGPWALVTGASSGIGEQLARQLARAGFNLLLVARREDRLRDLRAELGPRRRREIEPLVADLADPEAVDRIVAGTAGRDVGLLVSNAGFGLKGAFESHGRARLEAMLNVNARAPLLLVHALLPRLRMRPTGGIILTGSQEGEAPFPMVERLRRDQGLRAQPGDGAARRAGRDRHRRAGARARRYGHGGPGTAGIRRRPASRR